MNGISAIMSTAGTVMPSIMSATGTVISAVGEFQAGMEKKAQSQANAYLAYQQAEAQKAQAEEYERQAKIEAEKAGIEQLQGEIEAERRSRLAAQEIGSTYAAAAGNGVLVSGSETDTFAHILKSQTQEANADIGIIKANTAMNVWSREENARSLMFSAEQSRAGAQNSLFSANEYVRQGKSAYKAGVLSAVGELFSGGGKTTKSAYSMSK